MTGSRIYFDPEDAKRRHFELSGALRTQEGRSYELVEWLGRGGHGSVFSCVDRGTGDEFAVKFLLTRGMKASRRFLREIKLLKQVENEHVIKIFGSGRIRGDEVTGKSRASIQVPFFVMDLAQSDLTGALEAGRKPAPETYMGQFRGLASALADLHAVAIHRDIKPENILVRGEKWMLGDYGLCAFHDRRGDDLTGDRENVGPRYWMSPEGHNRRVGRDDKICEASDVYQMAAVFWYVVTGRHPSGTLTREDWSGPDGMFDPLHRSLMHDLRKRPADGKAFYEEIVAALAA